MCFSSSFFLSASYFLPEDFFTVFKCLFIAHYNFRRKWLKGKKMRLPRGVIRRQGRNFNTKRAKNTEVRRSKKPTRSKTRIKLITKLERCRVKDEIRRTNLRSPWLAYCGGTLRLHFKGTRATPFVKMKLPMERYLCSNAPYCHLRSEEWNYR